MYQMGREISKYPLAKSASQMIGTYLCPIFNVTNITDDKCCCCLPCNHCSNWTWVVEEILAFWY